MGSMSEDKNENLENWEKNREQLQTEKQRDK